MSKQGDYQVLQLGDREFWVYQFEGPGRKSRHDLNCTTEEEVQLMVSNLQLVLVESGTVGTWPMRIYRQRTTRKAPERQI